MDLAAAIEQLCHDLLQQSHPGWENNDGAFGDFVFDAAARMITLDHNKRYTAAELSPAGSDEGPDGTSLSSCAVLAAQMGRQRRGFPAIHAWFDASKAVTADFRHRALRHHAEGIFMAQTLFGVTITLGWQIPTRWVGEQHVREDRGHLPSFADWARPIRQESWTGRSERTEPTLDRVPDPGDPAEGITP